LLLLGVVSRSGLADSWWRHERRITCMLEMLAAFVSATVGHMAPSACKVRLEPHPRRAVERGPADTPRWAEARREGRSASA
jgi:hypothetical protein